MAGKGLFPDFGVEAGSPSVAGAVSWDVEIDPKNGCVVRYHRNGCRVEFSREQANFLLANWARALDSAGMAYDCSDPAELAEMMSRHASRGIFGIGGGTANAQTVTALEYTKPPTELFDGMWVVFFPAATNTTAMTLAPFGLPQTPVLDEKGAALLGDEVQQGLLTAAIYSEALSAFMLPHWAIAPSYVAPIFPEIEGVGNALSLTATTGQIVVDAAQTFVWRGQRRFSPGNVAAGSRTFATSANKTYHVVWDAPGTGLATPRASYPSGRYSLIDRTGGTETDAAFDTTYDRMLIARVVTNGSNVLTVTPLKNKALLTHSATDVASTFGYVASGAVGSVSPTSANRILFQWGVDMAGYCMSEFTLNWARRPATAALHGVVGFAVSSAPGAGIEGVANYINARDINRYRVQAIYSTDWSGNSTSGGPIMVGGSGQVSSAYASCDLNAAA